MSPQNRSRLWRTLALCMVIGAIGLGVYYVCVQVPLQEQLYDVRAHTEALHETITEERAKPPVLEALPEPRLTDACAAFETALADLPHTLDPHGTLFAVQELARNAGLEDYTVAQSQKSHAPFESTTRYRITLTMQGEREAIHRLLSNIRTYGKAGRISSLEIVPKDKERFYTQRYPRYLVQATLDAFTVPPAADYAKARCVDLRTQ